MRGYPWGTPGEALRLRGPQDRFFIDFGPFLGPLLGPKLGPSSEPWGVLERLDTAQGGLCALWDPFFSHPMTYFFKILILHRFRTPKQPQKSLQKH